MGSWVGLSKNSPVLFGLLLQIPILGVIVGDSEACYCCLLNQSKFRQMSYPTYSSIDPKNTPVMIVSLFT